MPNDDTVFLNSNVDVLSFFDPEELRKVTPDIEHSTYTKGDNIIFKGQITDGFYIIKQGKVLVKLKNKRGKNVEVPLETGDFFGEISVLEDTTATASVHCAEDNTEILVIPHSSFRKLCEMEAFLLMALKKKADKRKADLSKQK
jgi:CRP-like cAMP-binding protein